MFRKACNQLRLRYADFGTPQFWEYMAQLDEGGENAEEVIPEEDRSWVVETYTSLVAQLESFVEVLTDSLQETCFGIVAHAGPQVYEELLTRIPEEGPEVLEDFMRFEDGGIYYSLTSLVPELDE